MARRLGFGLEVFGCIAAALVLWDLGTRKPKAVGRSHPRLGDTVRPSGDVRIEKLVVAGLRGFCAGVVRAIEVVEKALEVCEGPVYVRKEIIHNRYVVDELRGKGARFVDDVDEVPPGSWLIYSAHGVSPSVRAAARGRSLKTIDATCPLVTKVHLEAIRYAKQGYTILFIGHADHDEAAGTLGEAPEAIRIVATKEEADTVQVDDPGRVAYLTQTTLSVEDTREIVAVLRRRFPGLEGPSTEDICYATQNRQDAVRAMAPHVDLLLVLGAPNSSNSLRLCEVAEAHGAPAHLIERAGDIRPEWLRDVRVLGLTASASAPEVLVREVVDRVRALGVRRVEEFETIRETVAFGPPQELRVLLDGASTPRTHAVAAKGRRARTRRRAAGG
jgi:4-hydroxy-3-methylbut-2-enyl diphosphate reductase